MNDDMKLGQLEILILSCLTGRQLYGLEIIKAVKETTKGRIAISIGSLYPTLYRLEKKGFLESKWGDTDKSRAGARRRYYHVTALGALALKNAKTAFTRLWRLTPRIA